MHYARCVSQFAGMIFQTHSKEVTKVTEHGWGLVLL
ncbi:DUF6783 domain-containing protein [Blautia wexlerae]